uniref:UBX domain-containing protein n=1 Tax=Steinernema glaseri TaxID=37863 RepID=A0A1I8AUC0_9BILA
MSRNINTLDKFRKSPAGDDDSSDEEHGPEHFFVGGGRDSGQQVLGPDAGNDGDLGGRIMRAAQRAGAEIVSPEAAAAARAAGSSSGAPSGGYRLGGHGVSTEAINPPPSSSAHGRQRVTFVMNLWTNGFSLDDGPLREFSDPSSTEFLQQVMKGEMPKELVDKYGPAIDIQMMQKGKEYVPPKSKPFRGQGHMVGGAPIFEENINAGAPLGREERAQLLAEAEAGVRLDESQPVTRIQIRFPDNERLIAQFNHFHTVEAIRSFITTANPNYAYRPFQFIGGFPTKPIDDETISLKDAGLLNAMVTVKFV